LLTFKNNIIVAGDHTVNGSIEGAVISGINTAHFITKKNYNH
jgi:predicted NAD/FAD-dependent oxidoreductase